MELKGSLVVDVSGFGSSFVAYDKVKNHGFQIAHSVLSLFCYLFSCLCLCFVLVLVTFVFLSLFLFLVSFTLCQKKNCKKNLKKKSGCLIFEHEIEAFRGVFFERKSWNKSPYLDSPLNSERFDI